MISALVHGRRLKHLLTIICYCACYLISNFSYAAEILPADITTNVRIPFDKSAPPANMAVWNNVRNGYNASSPGPRTRDWFTCKSETDTQTGACSRGWFHFGEVNKVSKLKLRVTELRSRVSVDIPLTGRSAACRFDTPGGPCLRPRWGQINDGGYTMNVGHNGKQLHIYFTAADLAAIPSGGIWQGTLVLEQRQWGAGALALKAHWTANITLDVTDRNNGAIYLPAFGKADAMVDLNLRTRPLSTAPEARSAAVPLSTLACMTAITRITHG